MRDFININKSQAKLEQLPASKKNFHQHINAVQSDTGTIDLQSWTDDPSSDVCCPKYHRLCSSTMQVFVSMTKFAAKKGLNKLQ